jgi:tRNA isopentenyl-2-thiomethyl-A-37 hydroxylase MiaE
MNTAPEEIPALTPEMRLFPPLHIATPAEWLERATVHWRELLVDHANCEKKAASTALSLLFTYAEDLTLAGQLSRLAREELRHFEQVQRLMVSLDIPFQRLSPSRTLRACGARYASRNLNDVWICSSVAGSSKRARANVSRPWRRACQSLLARSTGL